MKVVHILNGKEVSIEEVIKHIQAKKEKCEIIRSNLTSYQSREKERASGG